MVPYLVKTNIPSLNETQHAHVYAFAYMNEICSLVTFIRNWISASMYFSSTFPSSTLPPESTYVWMSLSPSISMIQYTIFILKVTLRCKIWTCLSFCIYKFWSLSNKIQIYKWPWQKKGLDTQDHTNKAIHKKNYSTARKFIDWLGGGLAYLKEVFV